MRVLTEYTLNYLKKNKKNTISIIIIISIAVILLSTMVLLTYMNWDYEINKTRLEKGNYHGTFKSSINKSQIPYLEENQKVDKVYLSSEYYTGKIDMERPFINISYMDKEYWENMGEKHLILEGRIPSNQDEIVVMGNLMKENPAYEIGSKIKINLGYREQKGKRVDVFDFLHEEESFIGEDVKEYTIVGIISGKSLSYEPYYRGLGFLDRESIDENIKLNTFLRMKTSRTVYKDLPEIGRTLGFEQGEETYSEYLYGARYNIRYLSLQGIFPPSISILTQRSNSIFVAFTFILLIMFMFSIIIYNVFAIWSNNRLRQLGIFKSIGATPKQIKRTVKIEAIYLSILPIILGVGLGHLFCYFLVEKIKDIANADMNGSFFNITFKTSPIIILIILVLSFLMILFSISRTAKKISKISPIDAIKHGGLNYNSFKYNKRNNKEYSSENIISSLSQDSLRSNKKGFRTTIISIGIGFTILFAFLVVMSGVRADEKLNSLESYYNIGINFYSNEIFDENLFKEISEIPKIKESIVYKCSHLLFKVKPENESDEFRSVGGFKDIDSGKFSVRFVDDYYEVAGQIIGMDHDKFNEYAKSLGQNPTEYYDSKNPKAIFLNLVKEDMNKPISRANYIPYLDDNINFLSFGEYGDNGYNHEIGILHKTYEKPWQDFYLVNYDITLIVPKEVLNTMMEGFNLPGDYSHMEYVSILADEEDIEHVKDEIKDIAKYYIPESDYYIWDEISYKIENENSKKILYLMTFSFITFMGIIGISNSYSSINNNLRSRRREFAMLKSMGMTKGGLKQMLKVEGMYYSIYPFICSIPLCLIILFGMVKTNRLYNTKDFLMYLDYKIMFIYIAIIVISIYSAYYFGIRKIEKEEIVDILRDESI